MGKAAALVLFVAIASPAFAAQRVTVAQLEQLLQADRGKPDATVAGQLSDFELSERLSSVRLARWEAELPGVHAREALLGLADASAFLELPADEIPAIPTPDLKKQAEILSRAIDYVSKAVPKLPNFFAMRETTRFEDLPEDESLSPQYASSGPATRFGRPSQTLISGAELEGEPLHFVGRSSVAVTYRDGHEVDAAPVKGGRAELPEVGLTTSGEFGPILGLVLADAVRSSVTWGHWEQGTAGTQAVFNYRVPQPRSHYMVSFPTEAGTEQQFPAYHGEIAVDPADGSVLRLTVVSDLQPPYARVEADVLVEYGPVAIGQRSYICPLKGVALSKAPLAEEPGKLQVSSAPRRTQVNDIVFTHYHVFRAESRIVTADSGKPEKSSPVAVAAPVAGALPVPASQPAPQAEGQREAAPVAATSSIPAAAESNGAAIPPASVAAEQAQASSPPAAEPVPVTAQELAPAAGPMVLHENANLVLLDVVVTDHDRAVHGLDRSRFHLFEDGKEQTITSFDEHEPAVRTNALAAPAALPANTYSNVSAYPEGGAVNVLLLDTLNTPQADQMNVRRQMLAYLGKISTGTSMAIFMLSARLQMVKGFSTDVAQLTDALKSAKAAPQRSVMLNSEGGASLSAAGLGMANASGPDGMGAMMQADAAEAHLWQTDVRARMTLEALQQLARYLSGFPGRKNLIWFSGSFPIRLGPGETHSSYADDVRKTSELMAEARVAVYPVGARGLMAQPSANAAYVAGSNLAEGRPTSFVEQTTSEETSMNEIADQTGGHAYLDSNGLKEAVETIVENGSSYYTLGYVPTDKRFDGQFRTVHLRLDNSSYRLSYRPGYYADDPSKASAHNAGAASLLAGATLLGAPPATQILFQARVLPADDPLLKGVVLAGGPAGELAESIKGPVRRFVVDLTVDPHSLRFEEEPDGARRTEMEFAVVAYDSETRRVNYVEREARINVPAGQYARLLSTVIPARLTLDLPTGKIALRVAVVDPVNGRAGSLEVPLTVAAR